MWIGQPCPMFRLMDNETYCILNDDYEEVLLVSFFLREQMNEEAIAELSDPTFCINAVVEDNDGQIKCPTKNKNIIIGGRKIAKEYYEKTLHALLFLDSSQDMCSDCIYKALVTQFSIAKKEEIV